MTPYCLAMTTSSTRTIPRLTWDDVDAKLRSEIEAQLGSRVRSAESREEGFSPGLASVCHLEDGRKVFVKAVSSDLNVQSRQKALHEIEVNRALHKSVQAPLMLAVVEHDEWVGAVFEVVEGRAPGDPWTSNDVDAVLRAIGSLDGAFDDTLGNEVDGALTVPAFGGSLAQQVCGWSQLAAQNLDVTELQTIEPWLNPGSVQRLAAIESQWAGACEPTSLVHADLRADNLLVDGDNTVWILDWANAAMGPAWFDVVALAPSIAMQAGPSPWEVWDRYVQLQASSGSAASDEAAVDVGVVAVAGFFTFQARQPAVPVIPMLRDFQEAQAKPARAWVQQRLSGILL